MEKIRVAIVGASGYSGEELIRLLLSHPAVELIEVTSRQNIGKSIADVFPKFSAHPQARAIKFTEPDLSRLKDIQTVFLALPHGVAAEYVPKLVEAGVITIDLSADFRLRSPQLYEEFYGHKHPAPQLLSEAVYGLPEIYHKQLKRAKLIACAGCYPTSILLPLIPLLKAKIISHEDIIINSLSGVSGAGRKAELDYLFVECNESLRPYSVPIHRHLSEIEQELTFAASTPVRVRFTPHLVPVNRGILTTIVVRPIIKEKKIEMLIEEEYIKLYKDKPFVTLLGVDSLPDTKHVVGTNQIQIAWRWDHRTGHLIIMSAIDNLIKGASGQAVQCFNIRWELNEECGLKLL